MGQVIRFPIELRDDGDAILRDLAGIRDPIEYCRVIRLEREETLADIIGDMQDELEKLCDAFKNLNVLTARLMDFIDE